MQIAEKPEMLRIIPETLDAGEFAERRNAIQARVCRSFADPRPDLTGEDAETALEAALGEVDDDLDRAAS